MELIKIFAFNPGDCSDVYDLAFADAHEHEFYYTVALIAAAVIIAALVIALTLVAIRYRRLQKSANSPRPQNKKSSSSIKQP